MKFAEDNFELGLLSKATLVIDITFNAINCMFLAFGEGNFRHFLELLLLKLEREALLFNVVSDGKVSVNAINIAIQTASEWAFG